MQNVEKIYSIGELRVWEKMDVDREKYFVSAIEI